MKARSHKISYHCGHRCLCNLNIYSIKQIPQLLSSAPMSHSKTLAAIPQPCAQNGTSGPWTTPDSDDTDSFQIRKTALPLKMPVTNKLPTCRVLILSMIRVRARTFLLKHPLLSLPSDTTTSGLFQSRASTHDSPQHPVSHTAFNPHAQRRSEPSLTRSCWFRVIPHPRCLSTSRRQWLPDPPKRAPSPSRPASPSLEPTLPSPPPLLLPLPPSHLIRRPTPSSLCFYPKHPP